jgi:glycosyltransferase involved in cell wall biosynthesis
MLDSQAAESGDRPGAAIQSPHILIGVTSSQTCIVLPGRLSALRAAGFQVSVLSAPGERLDRMAEIDGVATLPLPMHRGISPVADSIALMRMIRLVRRVKPDIVEFSTPKAGLLGSVAAFICRVPARIYFLRGLKLETAHGLKRALLTWAERLSASCAHVVLCNSRSLREQALTHRVAPRSKMILLGEGSSNGVDVTRFAPGPSQVRSQFGIPGDAPVIGFAGRLTMDKGLPELLEAFTGILRRIPNAYLLLVGWFDAAEDAVECGLRARVESHPRIVLTGYVSDTAPFYRAMDFLILPSWREGFPNVVLEAAASGLPVIATLSTGCCDAVIPEVTGLLVPPGCPEAICEAAVSMIRDPEGRGRMGHAARSWVVENYSDRRILGLTVEFYKLLLDCNGSQAREMILISDEAATGLRVKT